MPELSREEKQTARIIIEKGLQQEIENDIIELEQIITRWREQKLSVQETWRQLYQSLKEHDKQIARRYDGLSGARYDITLASQLRDGVINPADLEALDEETKSTIMRWSELA